MTQEEKQLLIKDLCARLPYGLDVEIKGRYDDGERYIRISTLDITMLGYIYDDEASIIPYLRPMSSMTDGEIDRMWEIYESGPAAESSVAVAEYLYERHLDCHYMIEKRLALEASEGMYKNE